MKRKHRRSKLIRALLLLCFSAAFLLGLTGQILAQSEGGSRALVAEVDGIINPVSARYIIRTLEKAEEEDAQLAIILLDTPGGLLSSTRDIFEALLNANVPTVVYVSPQGAQAASAGTFITAAANVAVMAPGTSIGAATPVGSGGEDLPETLSNKVTNAAAADMRSIAAARGRNVEELEKTVVEAKSFSADEAVALNVVDFIAQDVHDLLLQLDGMTVTVNGEERVLNTEGMQLQPLNMSLIDKFLYIVADPNISFLLLSVGGLAIAVEVLNPGLIFPGVTGAIFLTLAFISLGNLPVNWAGAALILLAAALLIAEVYVAGFGVLGVGGIVCFVLGGLLLFAHFGTPSPTAPSIGVSPWALWPFVGIIVGVGGWVASTIVRQKKAEPIRAPPPLLGSHGIVTTELNPRGVVQAGTEVWTARSYYGMMIPTGAEVEVVGVDGATVTVVRSAEPDPHSSTHTEE